MPQIISADTIKTTYPGYSPENVEEFHTKSARQADAEFETALKSGRYKRVVLLSGGTASSKTEFLETHLKHKQAIIMDATLSTIEGAMIKVSKVMKAGLRLRICAVIPDSLSRAFLAFLHRDRKFKDEHFYKTHSGSRNVLLWVAQSHPEIELNIVESYYDEFEIMKFRELKFKSGAEKLSYIRGIQMGEVDIIKLIYEESITKD